MDYVAITRTPPGKDDASPPGCVGMVFSTRSTMTEAPDTLSLIGLSVLRLVLVDPNCFCFRTTAATVLLGTLWREEDG